MPDEPTQSGQISQPEQTVGGNQTNVAGSVSGGLASGTFHDKVEIGKREVHYHYAAPPAPTPDLPSALPPNYRRIIERLNADYSEIFGGRDAQFAALDRLLADPAHPYALLLAPTGRGKTALLLNNDLNILLPWLAALGPEALPDIAQSIIDVARAWP